MQEQSTNEEPLDIYQEKIAVLPDDKSPERFAEELVEYAKNHEAWDKISQEKQKSILDKAQTIMAQAAAKKSASQLFMTKQEINVLTSAGREGFFAWQNKVEKKRRKARKVSKASRRANR